MTRLGALVLALALAVSVHAQPAAAPTPLSTDAAAFAAALPERDAALAWRITGVQATLAETRTATVPGLAPALTAQVASLERVRTLLRQQNAALQEATNLAVARQQLEGQLEALRSTGMPEPPPYALPVLDRVLAERETEVARRTSLDASLEAARQALEEARRQRARALEELAAATRARVEAADPTLLPARTAAQAAAEAARDQADEAWRLRELEHANERRDLAIHELRVTLLDERIQWVRKDLTFPRSALEEVVRSLEKDAFDIQRALDTARLELTTAERRWTSSRQRLDAATDPDELLAEEVQTRFSELQSRQREVALYEKRLARLEARRKIWEERFRVATEDLDREARQGLADAATETAAALGREEHLQVARLVELRRDLQALDAQIASSGGADPRMLRWMRERRQALERFVRAGDGNLASLQETARLAGRLLDELRLEAEAVPETAWTRATAWLQRFWTDTLGPLAGPALNVFLLLFLGLPGNFFLSKRIQAWCTRLYNAQSGMIAGKVVYYGGLTLIVIVFLNQIGVGLAPLLGAAGVTGVALGFASQASVSNIISGLFLIAEQPFKVDDIIVVGDVTGQVLSIDLLSVKLRQFDNKFSRIPNETILRTNVTNISRHPIRRVETVVAVAYKEDLEKVVEILKGVARDDPDVLQNPEPTVIFQGFGSSGIDYKLCSWVARENFLKLLNRVPIAIKKRFEAEGIEIPFPHLSLYRGSASRAHEIRLLRELEEEDRGPEEAG